MSFFFSGGRWFSFEMTFCPVCTSSAFLAFQATAHHSLEACCISFHQVLSFFFMISVVEASPSIVNIVSRSVIWSRRLSVFTRCHPEGRTRDLGGEYAILSLFDSSCIPLIGEVFSYGDTSHTLIDPLLAISFCFIGLCHSLHSELRIFDLLYSLISYLGEPSFEWFCFR